LVSRRYASASGEIVLQPHGRQPWLEAEEAIEVMGNVEKLLENLTLGTEALELAILATCHNHDGLESLWFLRAMDLT
jgi:hypothetical protein